MPQSPQREMQSAAALDPVRLSEVRAEQERIDAFWSLWRMQPEAAVAALRGTPSCVECA